MEEIGKGGFIMLLPDLGYVYLYGYNFVYD
jgi:hypothetical protein